MTPILLSFLALVILTCGSGLAMLFTRNILHAALAMFMCMLGLAGLYVIAYADVMAVSHLMIYVGGVLILILFGIMLTTQQSRETNGKNHLRVEQRSFIRSAAVGLSIFIGLIYVFSRMDWQLHVVGNDQSKLRDVGVALLTKYAFPFELVGVYLLIALVGATYIAKRND
ncbi:NADH-quinone oxidoreductase subunit J [Aquirufa sp.]|jgi:NADH-quinone oxidoreductase subunit J|uniref:NADH-quinone oxidoreductase subunit J n=1 Tax=Aquirufa sp. TaxID=2676249 RepID=UPI0037C0A974